jgi:hypothetical protein
MIKAKSWRRCFTAVGFAVMAWIKKFGLRLRTSHPADVPLFDRAMVLRQQGF